MRLRILFQILVHVCICALSLGGDSYGGKEDQSVQ